MERRGRGRKGEERKEDGGWKVERCEKEDGRRWGYEERRVG